MKTSLSCREGSWQARGGCWFVFVMHDWRLQTQLEEARIELEA